MPESFINLRKIYEQGFDLDKMSHSEEGLLFLKIRSLTKKKLKEFCISKNLIDESQKPLEWQLREKAFGNTTNSELDEFILANVGASMSQEVMNEIIRGVKEVENHASSIFLDSFDSALKKVVRDKNLRSLTTLNQKISSSLIPKLKSYVTWSWFNQNTNDLIEEIFKRNDKIIPTLRRVHGVDFFIKSEGLDVPVDLKLTFLPKEFIKIYTRQGKTTKQIISMVKDNPKILANWLYENQNPRLFNNNIRFFIVLIDKEHLENSWKLKAEFELIHGKVNTFLSTIDGDNLIEVKYSYNKEDRVAGNYKTKCYLLTIEK